MYVILYSTGIERPPRYADAAAYASFQFRVKLSGAFEGRQPGFHLGCGAYQ